ncbi:hypothetical protein HK096_002891, partial [Nowakowskiella sp. JEL0078]
LIHKWFPEEAIKNYQPSQGVDLDYDRFRYLMMSYLDTSVLEKNEVVKKINQPYLADDEEGVGHRGSKHSAIWKKVLFNPVSVSWIMGVTALILLFIPLIIGMFVNTTSLYFLRVDSTTPTNTTVLLGIYSPIILKNGETKFLPRMSEDLENTQYLFFPPESIALDVITPFDNEFTRFAYGAASRPYLALLFLIITAISLLLSMAIRLAAVAFEIQSILEIGDKLVPAFSIFAALTAIFEFTSLMAWFGTYQSVLNKNGNFVTSTFGPGLYITSVGLLLVVALSGLAIFEGLRLKQIKLEKQDTLKRGSHVWFPPQMPYAGSTVGSPYRWSMAESNGNRASMLLNPNGLETQQMGDGRVSFAGGSKLRESTDYDTRVDHETSGLLKSV